MIEYGKFLIDTTSQTESIKVYSKATGQVVTLKLLEPKAEYCDSQIVSIENGIWVVTLRLLPNKELRKALIFLEQVCSTESGAVKYLLFDANYQTSYFYGKLDVHNGRIFKLDTNYNNVLKLNISNVGPKDDKSLAQIETKMLSINFEEVFREESTNSDMENKFDLLKHPLYIRDMLGYENTILAETSTVWNSSFSINILFGLQWDQSGSFTSSCHDILQGFKHDRIISKLFRVRKCLYSLRIVTGPSCSLHINKHLKGRLPLIFKSKPSSPITTHLRSIKKKGWILNMIKPDVGHPRFTLLWNRPAGTTNFAVAASIYTLSL